MVGLSLDWGQSAFDVDSEDLGLSSRTSCIDHGDVVSKTALGKEKVFLKEKFVKQKLCLFDLLFFLFWGAFCYNIKKSHCKHHREVKVSLNLFHCLVFSSLLSLYPLFPIISSVFLTVNPRSSSGSLRGNDNLNFIPNCLRLQRCRCIPTPVEPR